MDEDEDSRLFLSMIDATVERIFEACSEIIAAESSAVHVACDTETVHQSTSNRLQQHEETCSQLNTHPFASQATIHQSTINRHQQDDESCSQLYTLPSAFQESSYCNKPRKRRKRSWTTDQHVLEESSSATQINLSANENTRDFVGWPQTFTFPSYEPGKPLEEFKAKSNVTFTKIFKQHQRKGAVRSNVGSSVNSLLGGSMLPPIAGIDDKCEAENTKKSDDFKKEIHEAIDRLESLIPSFQKLINGVEKPINQQNVGKLELRNNSNSNSEDDEVNRLGMTHVLEVTKNDVANAGKYAERSEYTFRGEEDQMFREGISEETNCSSPSSTSNGTSVRQSSYPSSYTGSYLSADLYSGGSDETADGSDSSQSYSDYDTYSDYNSQGRYSDISPSSQGSSEWSSGSDDHRIEKGQTVQRISTLWNKLGTIFHHPHHRHHHHHHSKDRDVPGLGHFGLLKRFGKFFHRSGKNDRERVKADKPQKPGNKSVVKKKQDVGHFRKLVDGLMRHKRHSKKPKKGKDDTKMLGSGHHKSKRTKNKLPWLPKMGRGKVEVPNNGKAKLKRIATKTAKMVLT